MNIKKLSIILIIGVISLILMYSGFLIFISWPIDSYAIANAGVFGDSFGVLTSLFSGLAFVGLIITILMQREELSLQRKELSMTRSELVGQRREMVDQNLNLKLQSFEHTFFKMLELLESCRNEISYSSGKYQGRDAIRKIYISFREDSLKGWVQDERGNTVYDVLNESKLKDGVLIKYYGIYEVYGDDLGQYYRTLYNILKFIETSEFVSNKQLYSNLVRAQLSRYELALLFYNCLSIYGEEKMLPLIKKYNLFKHIEKNDILKENIYLYKELMLTE